MLYTKIRKTIGLALVTLIIMICFTTEAQSFFSLPTEQHITVGDKVKLNLNFPKRILANLSIYVESRNKNILNINGYPLEKEVFKYENGTPVVTRPGKFDMQLRLFGLIPIRSMHVEVIPKIKLIPGGHSIGILLQSQGVMVVGQSIIVDTSGNKRNPAKEAGIDVGDIIIKINGKKAKSDQQVAILIDKEGKTGDQLRLYIKRNGEYLTKIIKPVYCKETQRYRIGLYIRDSAAGVGTLSFYDPLTKSYGALGHVITDVDTNQKISVGNGKVIKSIIQGIQPGTIGHPGEKIGMFVEKSNFLGNIEKNTNYGLYGNIKGDLSNPLYPIPLPIALVSEVKEGPAEILTVIDGDKIEKFKISIEKLLPQQKLTGKGMIIKIKDKRLLHKTGGIIQGMSGSPIIQNKKIVGAVTHVFVNDPTRGYGIFVEWMLTETKIKEEYQKLKGNQKITISRIDSIRDNIPDTFLI